MAVPWITASAATSATAANPALTDAELDSAAVDIYDYMRWTPDSDEDLIDQDRRRNALGRAIAWQALDRRTVLPTPSQGDGTALQARSIGNYSESFVGTGKRAGVTVCARSRSILNQHGLMLMTGKSGYGPKKSPVERIT